MLIHTCTGSGMQRSIYKTRQMNAEILTKVRNLLVDPFSWNGLKQQLTLVDTHFARLAHTRERREKPITITPSLSRVSTLSRLFAILIVSHFSLVSFVLFRSSSYSFSFSFHSCQNPDASDGRIDRKKRTLLTVGMIISAPMMLSL